MKKFRFSLWVAMISIVAFLLSCQKDNITVTLKTAGTLNVQIADSTGKAYPKVKVHLYTYYSSSSSNNELDSKTTDSNGNASFGTLESGTYYVVTDTVKNGNKKYLVAKAVQVISGETKNFVINPMEYVGTIKIYVRIYTNGMIDTLDRKTLKVALINYSDYQSNANRQKVISKAVDIKSCNANGIVEFDNVPANIEYRAYVYINNSDTIGGWSSDYYNVSKDGTYSEYADVNLSDLIIIKTNVTINLTYYSYSTSTYKPVNAANVVLVKSYDYSNYALYSASQSTILLFKVVSGKTNNGVVTFTNVPANVDYRVYVYYDNLKYTWLNSYVYPYQGTPNNYDLYLTSSNGSDLGLTK